MLGLPRAVWCVAFDVRHVTRQVQERDDAARQAQQQRDDGQRADTERQQRHEAEIESLRSELKAARDDAAIESLRSFREVATSKFASLESRLHDLSRALSESESDFCDVEADCQDVNIGSTADVSYSEISVASCASVAVTSDRMLSHIDAIERRLLQLQEQKQSIMKAREDAESQMLKASEMIDAVQRGRDQALLKEKESALQARQLHLSFAPHLLNACAGQVPVGAA